MIDADKDRRLPHAVMLAAMQWPMPAPYEEEDAQERIAALKLEVDVRYDQLPGVTHFVTKDGQTGCGYSLTEALYYAEYPIDQNLVSWKDMRLKLEADVNRRWPKPAERTYPSDPQASVTFDDSDPEST